MSAHTPGPWRVGTSEDAIDTGEPGQEFVVHADLRTERGAANAALIAAAPDLLAACEEMVRTLVVSDSKKFQADRYAAFEAARAAIAKARGGK